MAAACAIARDEARADCDVDALVDVRRPVFSHFDLVAIKHLLEDRQGGSVAGAIIGSARADELRNIRDTAA